MHPNLHEYTWDVNLGGADECSTTGIQATPNSNDELVNIYSSRAPVFASK